MALRIPLISQSRLIPVLKYLNNIKTLSSLTKLNESEYTETPEYPAITDPSKEGIRLLKRLKWYQSIRKLPTVEQKLHEILQIDKENPHGRPFKARLLNPDSIGFDQLPFYQYCTQTHVINGIPDGYHSNVDDILERVREPFLEVVRVEEVYRANKIRTSESSKSFSVAETNLTKNLLNEIMFLTMSSLGCENDHLAHAEVIERPRCDSYWFHGDYDVPKKRDGKLRQKQTMDICLQYSSKPVMQIRTSKPLPSIFERTDPICQLNDLPKVSFHPSVYKIPFVKRTLTSVPGCWSGSPTEFPFLSMDSLANFHSYRHYFGNVDIEMAVVAKGLLSSFGWLMGIATNLGFTLYDELTYPLTTQTILTNGKEWWFFVYQMNTIALHSDTNPRTHRNILWHSGPQTLYNSIEDGELKGVNDNVIKTLLQFLVKSPVSSINFDTKPYLGEQNISEEEMAQIVKEVRRAFDNRPKFDRNEVPTWHHVYKTNPIAMPSPRVRLW